MTNETHALLSKARLYCVDRGGHRSWTGSFGRSGYPVLSVRLPEGPTMLSVRRLFWEEVNGPIGDDVQVRRTCKDPTCVLPDHCVLGTRGKPKGATMKPTLAMQEAATYALEHGLVVTAAAQRAVVSVERMKRYLKKVGIQLPRGHGGRPTKEVK